MGFYSPFSSTYKVLLSQNRMVHNINVTFNDSNCTEQRALPSAPPQPKQLVDVRIEQAPPGATEEERGMGGLQHHTPHSHLQSQSPSQHSTLQFPWPSPVASMSPLGTPVGSHSQHSSQSTQFSQSPSPFAGSQCEGGNATVHGNPEWQPPQLDVDNDGVGQYSDLDNPDQQEFWYQKETVGTRATRGTRNDQPSYVFLTQIEKAHYLPEWTVMRL